MSKNGYNRGPLCNTPEKRVSYHIKAGGEQEVVFDPQDPGVLVALKTLGTLQDKGDKTK